MRIALLSTRKCNPISNEQYIYKALLDMGHEIVSDIDFRAHDPADFDGKEIDLLLAWKAPVREWGRNNYEQLLGLKCPKVLWYPDLLATQHAQIDARDLAPYYDYLFTCGYQDMFSYGQMPEWRGKKIEFLPPGVDIDVFKPLSSPRIYDVGFVGSREPSIYTERIELLKQLDKDFIVAVNNKPMSHQEIAIFYNQCKVVFNHGLNRQGVQLRILEGLACGRCVITNATAPHEMLFKKNLEILYYHDYKNLFELVVRCKNDINFREEKGRAGRREVEKRHTWQHRLETLFKKVGVA